jgi:hypothetical protein
VYDYYTYEARDHMEKRMREAQAERTARQYARARRQRRRRARMAAAWQMMTARQRTA